MFDGKFDGTWDKYSTQEVQPCYCCGARLRKQDSKLNMKRSNFINIKAGRSENWVSKDNKREIVTVQTSNGPITLGMRYEW